MTTELKIKESLSQRLLVAAIDLGTTYSGYAFSLRREPFDLKGSSTLHHPAAYHWGTTTSVLLLDENKKFVAFGYEAEESYNQLVDKGMHGKYYYCRRFKMSLHTSVIMDINYAIKDFNGKEVEALIVFSESIKYLKNHAEELINKSIYGIASDFVEWVIIVPAMWTDAGKQFMRKAAEKAGIKDEQLKIVLEPEAALCLYKHMHCIETNTTSNQDQTDREFQHGAKYLVVNMGDDTVEITLYQVVDETSLREFVPSCGGHWGGTTVDDSFVRFLESIVGKNVFNSLAEEDPDFLNDLHGDFALMKWAFGHNCNNLQDNIRTETTTITGSLLKRMRIMFPDTNIDDVIEKDATLKGKVIWKKDKLNITSDLFASFFETCLEGTIHEIEGVLGNSADVEAILLVGSCAEWPLIHKRIKSQFPNKRIIVPEYAGFAVVRGAVIYGHFPTTIVSRVARHSYGIRVYRKFLPGQHPEDKLVVIGTKRKCKDVFAVHVKKGQELRVGEVQSSQRYTRLSLAQKSLIFDFFSSTSENPQYVTDRGCEELGQLEVELDSRSKGVVISLKYGETEMEVDGLDEMTGKRTTAIFKFLKERDER